MEIERSCTGTILGILITILIKAFFGHVGMFNKNINYRDGDLLEALRDEERPLLFLVRWMVKEQASEGRILSIEQPPTSDAWMEKEITEKVL